MTEPNTFLADLIRGIVASAPPQVEDGGFIDRSSVQNSRDPLDSFETAVVVRDAPAYLQAAREVVRL
jgi:hypothetical protein